MQGKGDRSRDSWRNKDRCPTSCIQGTEAESVTAMGPPHYQVVEPGKGKHHSFVLKVTISTLSPCNFPRLFLVCQSASLQSVKGKIPKLKAVMEACVCVCEIGG